MTNTTSPIRKKTSSRIKQFLVALFVGLVFGFLMAEVFSVLTGHRLPECILKTTEQNVRHININIHKSAGIGNHNHTYENTTTADKLYGEVRVLCWVMTNSKTHDLKASHIKETWGKRCNKLLFMSTTEKKDPGTIALPVVEEKNNAWGKTKEALKYIYQHHMNDADWFLKTDEDTYIIVENLRYMLYPYPPETPIYFGCKFNAHVKQGYMANAAGYVLSKEAVRRFVTDAIPRPLLCKQGQIATWEDVEIGRCLENVKVRAGDSIDSHGLGKFFPFAPSYHLIPKSTPSWYWNYNFYKNNITNSDCCSDDMISFHNIPSEQMLMLDFLIYHLQPYGMVRMSEPLPNKLTIEQAISTEMISKNASTLAANNVLDGHII